MKRIDPNGDGEVDVKEWWENLIHHATSGERHARCPLLQVDAAVSGARVSLTLRLICGYLLRSLLPFLTCIYETLLDLEIYTLARLPSLLTHAADAVAAVAATAAIAPAAVPPAPITRCSDPAASPNGPLMRCFPPRPTRCNFLNNLTRRTRVKRGRAPCALDVL